MSGMCVFFYTADMAGASSKFNKLLQDAVSQSVG